MELNKDILKSAVGGASSKSWGLGILFAALGTMLVGLLDGFMRPLSCNS